MKGSNINKRIIKILLSVTVLVLVMSIFFSINVSAHPASDMTLSYDYDNEELNVEITHNVGNINSHYIDNVTIKINDEIYEIFTYTGQPTDSSFTYTYDVNASIGDEIEVYTHCNVGGDLTKKISVTSTGVTESESEFTVEDIIYYSIFGLPFILYIGIVTLALFILIAGLAVSKRKGLIKYPLKWHIWLAYIAIFLAIIHGILGILIYV